MRKISIKREQSQAGLSFAEREKFRPQVKNKLLLLLALLLTAATGAWAQETQGPWISGDCTVTISGDVMTVSGTGAMANYKDSYQLPWYGYDIKTIVIESGVTGIGKSAFARCRNLESVSIPASVTSIGMQAFEECGSEATNPLTVSFAEGSTPLTIGVRAFYYANLTSIDIPNRVTSIGGQAFSGCSNLESVSIPASVTSISEEAFCNCGMLAKVYIFAPSLTTYGAMAFADNAAGRKIYVLSDAVDTYKAGWSAYAADIEAMPANTKYTVTLAEGTKDAGNWSIEPKEGLSEGDQVTVKYNGRLKVKGVKATSDAAPAEEPVTLATPLTIEAITAGTIQVNIKGTLDKGMKYSVNGGTKTPITSTTTIEGLKAGDKVQFYSNGTGNTAYNIDDPKVKISGGTAEVKVYGNIMSLLDEEGFATKTDLQIYAFLGLFMENTTLIDASELLLPAATLAVSCYQQMFQGCTALTKAPKLPATWLESYCYYSMFSGCTSLTSAYVKAAYINVTAECDGMFYGCTATGAVLHTTSESKASWEGVMGTGKTWPNWTVTGDWQE
ncbi:leucine-rich repeat domain-containing protein [Prevotella communis]|uniref:leucine-rich repeat domain-containing protein n=1 Tax=Prevotella communis TaxID=2913614 RepID=UPI001EDC1885|nr:leucine-rich repeat domain-containing protein [Prevotella communis]UKK59906.1 leucine-rich repeat domain-containing protein [Prevotella communis]